MVKTFKRVLMGAILFAGINVMAGGFDADSSNDILDNSDDASESRLDDAGHRIVRYHLFRDCVESYIQAAAKEKGIKKPVKLASLEYTFFIPEAFTGAFLTKKDEKVSRHVVGIVMNPLFPVCVFGIIHHELGHALFRERNEQFKIEQEKRRDLMLGDQSSIDFLQKKEELYQEIFAEEQFADAAVPDNKTMLKSVRSLARVIHGFDCFDYILRISMIRKMGGNQSTGSIGGYDIPKNIFQMSLTDRIKMFGSFFLNEWRTFSKPMDEAKARELDKFHFDDMHPSSYRRAYYFDDRIKALEAKEHSVSIEKGAAFNDHVEQLTTSDLLS